MPMTRDTQRDLTRSLVVIAGLGLAMWAVHALASSLVHLPREWNTAFHTLVETGTIVVCFLIFTTVWHARNNSPLVLTGYLFLGTAIFTAMHVLAFDGMAQLITSSGEGQAISYFFSQRLLAAVALLLVVVGFTRVPSHRLGRTILLLSIIAGAVGACVWMLFKPDLLPVFFVQGRGLTPLKTGVDYAIFALHVVTAAGFLWRMRAAQRYPAVPLFAACSVLAMSELCFIAYTAATHVLNMVGHIYQIVGYGLVYRAVYIESILSPYHQLEASEATLRAVIDHLPDGVWCRDAEQRVRSANATWARWRGIEYNAVVGTSPTDLFSGEKGERFYAENRSVMESGVILRKPEERVTIADGTTRWFVTTKVPMRSAAGTSLGLVCISRDVTELHEAHEALRHERNVLQATVDAMAEGVVVHDASGRIVNANPAAETILGADRAQLLNAEPADSRWRFTTENGERLPTSQIPALVALRTGAPVSGATLAIDQPDGSRRWLHANAVPITGSSDVAGVVCTFTDITALRLALEASRISESRYRMAIQAADKAVWDWAIPEDRGTLSAGWWHMVGYEPSAAPIDGRFWREHIHPDDRVMIDEKLTAHLDGKTDSFSDQYRMRHADGHWVWIHVDGRVVGRDDQGRPVRIMGTVKDISAAKSAEVAVHEAGARMQRTERRLAAIIETAMDAVISVDEAHRIVVFNPAAERMFGCLAAEVLGMPVDVLLPRATHGAHAFLSQDGDRVAGPGIVGRRCNNEEFPIEASISRVSLGGETITTTIVRDISKRLEAEAAIADLTHNLERRVEERTQELELLNRDLESFNAWVSHDLRAPLRAICGFGKELQDRHAASLDAHGHHLLQRILDNGERMGHLIEDLLRLSRLRRKPIATIDLDMAGIARRCVERLCVHYPKTRITVGDLEHARGDAGLIEQVYFNLIENALKYSANVAAPRVHIGSRNTDPEVTYFVEDNGAGFDMRYVHKLFHPFQRLHSSIEFSGTGIGLAMVKQIVERHGGRIRAEGMTGSGAIFFFTLSAGT